MHRSIFRIARAGALGLLTAAAALPHPAYAMGGDYGGAGNAEPSKPRDYRKGVALIEDGKYEDGIARLKKAEEKTPHDADLLNYIGFAYRKLGENAQSLDYYQRALRENPSHLGANEYLGELYLQMNDLPKARAQLDVLKTLCDSCAERTTLTQSIADYKPL